MERKNRCCIATCKGERFDLAHKFPRSQEVAESWLQAIDNPNFKSLNLRKLSESYLVCARHFQISDYKHPQSRYLNKLAVPSLNLHNLSQLHLARDSTPRETDDAPSSLDILYQTHQSNDSPRETVNPSLSLKNMNQMDLATDSTPCVVAESEAEYEPSNVICDENTHAATIDVNLDVDSEDSVDKIEFIEIISDEMDQDSTNNQPDFVEEKITFKATDFTTILEIIHPKHDKPLNVNAFWLRCHCDCSECFDLETRRKKFNPIDIPKYIQPKDIRQDADTDIFLVEWEDGHCSTYDIEFLLKIGIPKVKRILNKLPFNWNTFKKPPQSGFFDLVSVDDRIENIFKNLTVHGFTCVTGIPTHTQHLSMAKLVIERLFPHLQTINFEPFNEIHADVCTNITCSNFDCGLKCFFATRKSEIILVDGLNVTEKLKESDVNAFKMLTCIPVPLNIRDNNVYHEKSAPIIELDNENEANIIKIQLDTQRFGALNMLAQERIENFYHSLEQFMTIIRTNKNQIVLNLEAGTMIILDNWRVMHKMLSNVGVLQCYLNRNDYTGRSRYLGLL